MMWTELPIEKRAPWSILLFDGIDIMLRIFAVAEGARLASMGLGLAILCTTVLYAASVRAARTNQAHLLKLYMNIAVVLFAIPTLLFLMRM
jgi:hypothetical protein